MDYILVIVGAAVLYFLSNKFLSSLRDLPGPFLAGFTELWKFKIHEKGNWQETCAALHKKYGPIVRIAPNEVLISDPEAIRVVYALRSGFVKSQFYSVFNGFFKSDLFTTIDEPLHSWKRKNVQASYSYQAVAQLEPLVDAQIRILFKKFDEMESTNSEVDLTKWFRLFAWDLSGELAYGRSFGFLVAGEDTNGYVTFIDEGTRFGATLAQIPWIAPALALLSWTEQFKKLNEQKDRIAKLTINCVNDRVASQEKGRVDLLSRLIDLRTTKGTELDDEDLYTAAVEVTVAASDTSSTTLAMLFYFLCTHPRVLRLLQEEVDKAEVQDGLITLETARNQMPYLQAVIKETLRMYPVVGYHLPRVVPPEGKEICGRVFKGNTVVGMNAWVIQRNPNIFGEDVNDFRPERWLDEERAVYMDRYMLAFGGGSRQCIGKHFAFVLISKTVPNILRRYDVSLVDAKEKMHYDNHWVSEINLTYANSQFIKPDHVNVAVKSRNIT